MGVTQNSNMPIIAIALVIATIIIASGAYLYYRNGSAAHATAYTTSIAAQNSTGTNTSYTSKIYVNMVSSNTINRISGTSLAYNSPTSLNNSKLDFASRLSGNPGALLNETTVMYFNKINTENATITVELFRNASISSTIYAKFLSSISKLEPVNNSAYRGGEYFTAEDTVDGVHQWLGGGVVGQGFFIVNLASKNDSVFSQQEVNSIMESQVGALLNIT